jgi:hypothetical protein
MLLVSRIIIYSTYCDELYLDSDMNKKIKFNHNYAHFYMEYTGHLCFYFIKEGKRIPIMYKFEEYDSEYELEMKMDADYYLCKRYI